MKIDAIEVYHVRMPLVQSFKTAFGNDDVIESVLIKMVSGDNYGWGEAAPWQYPTFSPEFASGQFLCSKFFIAPSLLNQNICSGDELQEKIAWIKGNFFAKAAFDLAWWDLHAKTQNKPLWQVIGGKGPEIETGTTFGILDSVDVLLKKIDVAVKAGFKRIKLKYSKDWGLEVIRTVRSQFPKTVFHIDCNSSFSLADTAMFKALDEFELAMIEQPLAFDDLADHAKLQSQIATPICLDESITSVDKARKAIQLKACRWINIKLGRCGGITNALKICRIASEAGIPCWVGAMLESAVGQSHSLNFATVENIKYPSSIVSSDKYYEKDLSTPSIIPISTGKFQAFDAPGIGVVPDSEMLDLYTVQKYCFDKNTGAKK